MSSDQLVLLQERLDMHIEECNAHRDSESLRWDQIITAQELNTKTVTELTESTRDLISAWNDVNGAVRTLASIGKFTKWISGFALLGVTIDWVVEAIKLNHT